MNTIQVAIAINLPCKDQHSHRETNYEKLKPPREPGPVKTMRPTIRQFPVIQYQRRFRGMQNKYKSSITTGKCDKSLYNAETIRH